MKRGNKSEEGNKDKILPAILLILIIAFFGFFIFKNPEITGFIIYGETISLRNWSFESSSDYSYSSSLIGVSGGNAELIPTATYTYWNTSTETSYPITSALYNPDDKTEKINSLDSQKHEVGKEKIFDVFFAENLDNGDIVSLYLEDGDEADIYLCKLGSVCSAPSYGSAGFNGSQGWHNITLSGLESPTKVISITPLKKIKFNYITSTKGGATKALYNPSDKTSKIQSKDNDNADVGKEKLFDVIFDRQLNNGDIISLYLKSGSEADIYACDYGDSCSLPGYGSVSFGGNEGYYNLTISGFDRPKNALAILASKSIKIDQIKAAHIETTEHSSENISYPASASIQTKDLTAAGLSSFLNFYKNDATSGQSISYYYSTDSGSSWNAIPDDGDLSGIGAESKKIRIKAEFSSDGSGTPVIYDFGVKYKTQVCNENWDANYGECLINNTRLKHYVDNNECGTSNNLPSDNGAYESCTYIAPCNEDWNATYGECLINNTRLKYYLDRNGCGTATNFPNDNSTYENCIYIPECTENWNLTYGGCLSNNTKLKYYLDINDCGTSANLPSGNTYEACDYCAPSWSCASYGECRLDNTKKCVSAKDNNSCYETTNLSSDSYSGDYSEFSLSCIYNKTGAGFSNLSVSVPANEKLVINKTNLTYFSIELNASISLENSFVSIIEYSGNKKNASPQLSTLNKYLDIESNNSLKENINSVKIRMHYTDEEINNASLDETALKIYYFNETSSQWQELNSIVNSAENYVEAEVGHLSTFGVFGEKKTSGASGTSERSSSGGSSGGDGESGGGRGGDGGRIISKIPATPTETGANEGVAPEKDETVKEEKGEEQKEASKECSYKLSVSIPEHISFIGLNYIEGVITNFGDCEIESLNIGLSPGLKGLIKVKNETIKNIGINESAAFLLAKKIEESKARRLLIQGFNIKSGDNGIKTYNGSLTFGSLAQDKQFEEKINVEVDLLQPISAEDIMKSKVPIISVIVLLFFGIIIYLYRKRKTNV